MLLYLLLLGIAGLLANCTETYDPYISNGTCYYGKDKEADPRYLPTGNVVFGVSTAWSISIDDQSR